MRSKADPLSTQLPLNICTLIELDTRPSCSYSIHDLLELIGDEDLG